MFKILFLAAVVALSTAFPVSEDYVSYDGHKVFRITPTDANQLEVLAQMAKNAHRYGLDFWTEPAMVGRSVDVRVPADKLADFVSQLGRLGAKYSVMIENVQTLVEQTMYSSGNDEDYFSKYHTVDETIAWYTKLVETYPNMLQIITVGKTYEGREIKAVKLSTGSGKKIVYLDGGIHAREWIAPAVVQYILNSLVTKYSNDVNITAAVDAVDWIIVPQYNIDGIKYTWEKDRMWRKTRSPNAGSRCWGTDPNRNWDFHWGEAGTSTDPCSDAYCGSKANSEIEVSSVAEYLKDNKDIHGYINFHAYSQLWMYPWAYTDKLDKDNDSQKQNSEECVSALEAVHGVKFVYGPIASTIYPASGSTVDYTYGTCGIKYSYGVELRDTGRYGFLLPPDQIRPSGEETLAAVLPFAHAVGNDQTLVRH